MVLTDQQLRQELINLGETVPPITQRNREQLRARLEVLRSHTRTRGGKSPSKSHSAASPSRTRAANSLSRPHGTASPSRTRAAAASPSRSNLTRSPTASRAAAASPSRTTRTSSVTNTSESRPGTRSKQTPNLIELSDSETDSAATNVLMSRSTRAGQTAPNIQTRSIAVRGKHSSPTSSSSSDGVGGPGNMTDDVEISIARHRREIKQLLDSARDRTRATSTNISSSHSGKHNEPSKTPLRSSSPSSHSKSRTRRQSSKSDDDHDDDKDDHDKKTRSPKSDKHDGKKLSALKRAGKPLQSFWKKFISPIMNILKALFVTSMLIGGIIFVTHHRHELFPAKKDVYCSVKNATTCEDMSPVIAAVRKQLQVRTGEVDCGFRPKATILVDRSEIERYLDERGFKFNLGNEERWKTLVTHILEKPVNDIIIWTKNDNQTTNINEAKKLSTQEAIRSLTCRVRQDVSHTIRNLILLILGSTGLLTLAWYLQKNSKQHDENESNYKSFLTKATDLIQEQYEKHIKDTEAQPWLAINHIRDKLIPEEDQEKLKHIWERVKNQISKQDSRIRSELQEINGKKHDVWRWIKSATSSPKKTGSQSSKDLHDESDPSTSPEVGLTECLKLRNCFRSDNSADDEEIDHIVDSIQNRCAGIKRIEHIGIHSVFVYLKFSSKEAAGQGYHLLNNWNCQDREINVKYVRSERYYEHFPEARGVSNNN